MKVDGKEMRPIWLKEDGHTVQVIDQRQLPHALVILDLARVDDVIMAIQEMVVRGAPLIGVTAAYGVFIAALNAKDRSDHADFFRQECDRIKAARPTAINLIWGVERVVAAVKGMGGDTARIEAARAEAGCIAEEEAENCRLIGEYGVAIVEKISRQKNRSTVNILTHCNAGWLACIEYGTATAPMYAAFEKGLDIHIWVDETRPLNQGARLTAWELVNQGIQVTVLCEGAAASALRGGLVDAVITGADRIAANGDTANKIGTYPLAVLARRHQVPFYVAAPASTFDGATASGRDIPIEMRDPEEVRNWCGVASVPQGAAAWNPAFDVTPHELVTAFITEHGVVRPPFPAALMGG